MLFRTPTEEPKMILIPAIAYLIGLWRRRRAQRATAAAS